MTRETDVQKKLTSFQAFGLILAALYYIDVEAKTQAYKTTSSHKAE